MARKSDRSGWTQRVGLPLLTTTAVLLSALAPIPNSAPAANARSSHDLPAPSAFKLPTSTFPAGSVVRAGRARERTLEVASGLHTVTLSSLGHLLGYRQSAWWWPPSQTRGHGTLASLQFMASIFASPDGANRAFADAQASLWELGYPLRWTVAGSHAFTVAEDDGHIDDYLLLHRSAIELELRLRYERTVSTQSLKSGLWHLWRAGHLAWKRAGSLVRSLPVVPAGTAVGALPTISMAPWGTGPVIKSPSLMVLDETDVDPDVRLAPGMPRSLSHQPSLASRAVEHARIVSPSALGRYVRTATLPDGGALYDTAVRYQSVNSAQAAFTAVVRANRGQTWLRPDPLDPAVWHAGSLTSVDQERAWRQHGETIIILRAQNILVVVAALGQSLEDLVPLATKEVKKIPSWLHAQGTTIETAGGDPVVLSSASWYGAEENDFVVGGLDYQPYQAILQRIKLLGFNSIRLPVSNQLIEQNPVITAHVTADPEFQGMRALDILDRIVNYAGALGLPIILDDHRSDAGWSTQADGLWYSAQYPESSFNADWAALARRYAANNAVIGADLRNEPHAKVSWGDGNVLTDWHAAAQRAGNGVLAANPHLLIIVEGIQFYKKAPSYWWGGSLMGVQDAPVELHFADGSPARSQLVYSVHDYGPDLCGKGCPWFNKKATYASLSQLWEQYWGYVVNDPQQAYAAPLWVGEFGTCNDQQQCVTDTAPGSQGQWFTSLVQYIAEKHVGWGYWSINGTQSTGGSRVYGTVEGYGLLDYTWATPYPWLQSGLSRILTPQPSTAAMDN